MKKFLALLLSVAMTLGCMGTVAFANEMPELPTATVTEVANDNLTFALNFLADEVTDEQLDYYGKWYADFELTVNKDVTFNADGGADGYLSGQYDAWSKENWVNVPFEDVSLNAGETLKIMEYAAEMLGQTGLRVTYNDVVTSVKDFDCGVFFEDDFLAANPDLVVTLELRMYNPVDEAETYVIGDTYRFYKGEPKAVIDGFPYFSLQSAIDAIGKKEGDYVINLVSDIKENIVITQNPNQTITIDGAQPTRARSVVKSTIDGTIKIDGRSAAFATAGVTFKNIVFDAANITEATAVIQAGWDNNSRYVSNLTIDNCDFVGTTDYNRTKVAAVRTSTGGSKNWTISNSTATGLHSFAQVNNVEDGFVVEDCAITDCKNGINLNNTESFTMTGTTVATDGYGLRAGAGSASTTSIAITLENNTINAGQDGTDEDGSAIVLRAGAAAAKVEITSGTYTGAEGKPAINVAAPTADVEISGGSFSSDVSDYLADGLVAAPDANGFGVLNIDSLADEIEVIFEDVTDADAEGEKLYNINLVATNNKLINRFNSADLTFAFKATEGDVGYEIIDVAGDNISVAPVDNSDERYEFHFDTKTDVADTANTITIAQVKFEGYGTYTFNVVNTNEANKTNAVHTTTLADNIVSTFIVDGSADGKGDLVINNSIIDGDVIAVPTRELTINIDFPNAVENNVKAYQNMTVTIVGGKVDITRELGTDGYAYKFTEKLPYNTPYTVTVKGAGYRTARYTVTLNDNKTLNFWNNVKDIENAKAIEDKGTVKVTKNFLAGDIVKDNNINIYDLSAVVSYFNTNTNTTAKDDNAKYDLNRDGVINSKDVAYVLVSWGE